MSEQEKKTTKIHDLHTVEIKLPPKKDSGIIVISSWLPSPDHNALHNAIRGVLENKTNATSHANFCSLKSAIDEGMN